MFRPYSEGHHVSEFDKWVSDNNPPIQLQYGKGFWDYVETVRRLAAKFEATDERAIGTYIVHTPPPEEELLMPAVAFQVGEVAFGLKYDFGSGTHWPFEWTATVKRPSPYRGPLFHLLDNDTVLSSTPIAGFGTEWTLPPYRTSQAAFTCMLTDEWDVAMLIRMMSHEA